MRRLYYILTVVAGRKIPNIGFFLLQVYVFAILVSCQKPKDPVVTITAVPGEVNYNEETIVSWVSSDAGYCTLNNTKVESSGSLTKILTETTKFTIIAYGEETTATAEVTVPVAPPPAPVISITAPTEQIPYANKVIYSWKVEGVYTSITLDGKDVTSEPTGSRTIDRLFANEAHTLVANGPGGTTTQNIQLLVGNWETSVFGLLTQGDVGKFELKYQDLMDIDRVVYRTDTMIKGDIVWTIEFSKTGIFIMRKDGEVFGGEDTFSLINDDTVIKTGDGLTKEIFSISKDSLVLIGGLIRVLPDGTAGDGWAKRYYNRI